MWYLLADRKLTKFRLYGPYETPEEADVIARKLLDNRIIKGWSVIETHMIETTDDGRLRYVVQL